MKKAFTLIELLIVVAIISALAGIAVSNLLEAQVRSKVSRAKADMRTLAAALESYAVDHNHYPPDITSATGTLVEGFDFSQGGYYWYISNHITSPVAYMTSNHLVDPFRDKHGMDPIGDRYAHLEPEYWRYRYVNYGFGESFYAQRNRVTGDITSVTTYQRWEPLFGRWRISSSGPDGGASAYFANKIIYPTEDDFVGPVYIYDATNGTVSMGDIVRCQTSSDMKRQN